MIARPMCSRNFFLSLRLPCLDDYFALLALLHLLAYEIPQKPFHLTRLEEEVRIASILAFQAPLISYTPFSFLPFPSRLVIPNASRNDPPGLSLAYTTWTSKPTATQRPPHHVSPSRASLPAYQSDKSPSQC